MSVVLRVSGRGLDVDALLASTSLEPIQVFRKGETKSAAPSHRVPGISGANFSVSDADMRSLAEMVEDVTSFLATNKEIVRAIRSFPGATEATLDFGVWSTDAAFASLRLPPVLVATLAELCIGIDVTLYPGD